MPYTRSFVFEDRARSALALEITECLTPDRVGIAISGYTVWLSRQDIQELHKLTSGYSSYTDYIKFAEPEVHPESAPGEIIEESE